jgi:hypothetical protein
VPAHAVKPLNVNVLQQAGTATGALLRRKTDRLAGMPSPSGLILQCATVTVLLN